MTQPRFVTIDLETRSACDLRERGGFNYANDPTTRLLTVAWRVDGQDHLWMPGADSVPAALVKQHLEGVTLHFGPEFPPIPTDRVWVGHNSWGFDEPVWEALAPPHMQPKRWEDSQCLAAAAGLPMGLQQIGIRLWGDGKYAEGSAALKKASRATSVNDCEAADVPVGTTVLVGRYNVQDVRLTADLMEHLNDTLHLTKEERALQQVHREINRRGARIDTELLSALYTLSNEAVADCVEQIAELTRHKETGVSAFASIEDLRKRTRVIQWVKDLGHDFGESLAREVVNTWIETESAKEPTEPEDTDPDAPTVVGAATNLQLVIRVLQLRQSALRITGGKLEAAGAKVDAHGILKGLFAYYAAHCVSGDTEVLTRSGWVRIDTWTGGEIAQWSPDGAIRFAPATANRFASDGQPMVCLDSPYATGRFTLGHTVPTYNTAHKFRDRKAGEMPDVAQGSVPISGVLDHRGSLTPEQMRVLVAVQADGHWITDTRQGRRLQFTFRKRRKIERIQSLLNATGIHHRLQEFPSCPGQIRVVIRWVDCPEWLTPERKVFGPWLLDSTPEAREAFATELQHWDGHYAGPHRNVEYTSYVPANLDWVITLCHLTGRAAKRTATGKRVLLRERRTAQVRARHWKRVPPTTLVYCPTTETGYWLCRHNGNISITGNTGRWAGRGVQVQNLPKPKPGVPVWRLLALFKKHRAFQLDRVKQELRREADRIAAEAEKDPAKKPLKYLPTCDDVASALIRSLFIPHEGDRVLLAADLAAIEVRVLSWLAGESWLLESFFTGADPYIQFCKKVTGRTITKRDKERDMWKAGVLGLGFQLGNEARVTAYVATYGIQLSDYGFTARGFVDAYREAHPKIAGERVGEFEDDSGSVRPIRKNGFWQNLQEATLTTVRDGCETRVGLLTFYKHAGNLYCILPSGREIVYRNARIVSEFKWGRDRDGVTYSSPRWKSVRLHGGIVAENVTQASASDFIRHALVLMPKLGLRPVLHVHDEIVASGHKQQLPEFMKAVTTVPAWAPGFPLGAEGGIIPRYAKSPPRGLLWKEQAWLNGVRV